MQIDFATEMAKRTDEELIQILVIDKENYLPEALVAAEKEFQRRNLQSDQFTSIVEHLSRKKEQDNIRSNEPLFAGIKIATFLFPLFITLILSGYYKAGGYDRKARDMAKWTLYGFCFYFLIVILVIVL